MLCESLPLNCQCCQPHKCPNAMILIKYIQWLVLKLSFKLWSLAAISPLTPPPSPPTQYESQAVNSSCESDMTHIVEMSIWSVWHSQIWMYILVTGLRFCAIMWLQSRALITIKIVPDRGPSFFFTPVWVTFAKVKLPSYFKKWLCFS